MSVASALERWINVGSPRKKILCSDQTRAVAIKDWWDQIAQGRPSTRGKWTGMAQSLRTVQCHTVSIRVPTGMPKSRCSSPEAELRWARELEGGGVPRTRDSVLPEEWLRQLVWAKVVTAIAGHVARKPRELIEDEV